MTPDARRFQFCLLASLVINSLGLLLAGWFWQPVSLSAPIFLAHIKLTALPLSQPPVHKTEAAPQRTPHTAPKRVRPMKHLRPGAQAHSSSPAPLNRPSSGSRSGSPPPRPVASPTAPAPAVITSERPLQFTAPQIQAPAQAVSVPTPAPTPLPADAITISPPVISGQGEPSATEGPGNSSGMGAGSNHSAGAGKSADAGEPFGVGQGLAGDGGLRHVVYVLDISGSMSSRIDRAEDELKRALNGLQPGETFNIVAFSERVQPFDTGMAPATRELEQRAGYFLSTLQVDGGTDLEAAMSWALSRPDVNEVVVLTDGVPTLGETDFQTLARHIQRMNRHHARISTVGLVGKNPDGTDDSFEAAALLRQIAHDSGGASKLVSLGVASP